KHVLRASQTSQRQIRTPAKFRIGHEFTAKAKRILTEGHDLATRWRFARRSQIATIVQANNAWAVHQLQEQISFIGERARFPTRLIPVYQMFGSQHLEGD